MTNHVKSIRLYVFENTNEETNRTKHILGNKYQVLVNKKKVTGNNHIVTNIM